MADEYVIRILRELKLQGITDYWFENRTKHRAVMVKYRGKIASVILPKSGSDVRGSRNAVTSLRKALGIVAVARPKSAGKTKTPKRFRSGPPRAAKMLATAIPAAVKDKFTANFLGPLEALKAQLDAAAANTVSPTP